MSLITWLSLLKSYKINSGLMSSIRKIIQSLISLQKAVIRMSDFKPLNHTVSEHRNGDWSINFFLESGHLLSTSGICRLGPL